MAVVVRGMLLGLLVLTLVVVVSLAVEFAAFVAFGWVTADEALGAAMFAALYLYLVSAVPSLLYVAYIRRAPGVSIGWRNALGAALLIGVVATLAWRLVFLGDHTSIDIIVRLYLIGLPVWIAYSLVTPRLVQLR